jgi:nicotinamide-nucleotide amidase
VCESRTAVIISAGTELTEGIIQDTHVRFLASELASFGFSVLRGVQIPDSVPLFRAELARAAEEACLVIITGGLGPTSDDLTREMVAEAAGVPLEFHPEAWEALLARFPGRTVSDTNRKQAHAPRGFALLPNPNGTAPGFHGALGNALVVSLPGPPSELRPMFSQSVLPLLRARFGGFSDADVLWATALMVPESSLEEALRACSRPGVSWGTRVEEDRIVFSLRGGARDDRAAFLDALVQRLGLVRIRKGETRPALLLTEVLLARAARLVTAESCTGGLVAKYMTDLAGSSRVFWGGFITYSQSSKIGLIGVEDALLREHGAVSEEAVRAMAGGAIAVSGAEVGIAVSGVAGPDGGTPEKPVGTVWMAAALKAGRSDAHKFTFTGSRDMIRRRSAVAALLLGEAVLLGREFLDSRAKW